MLYQAVLSFCLIAAAVALVWAAPFEIQVIYRKEGKIHWVSVGFTLLAGRAGLSWGPYSYEWTIDWHPFPLPSGALPGMKRRKELIQKFGSLLRYLPAVKQSIKKLRLEEWRWFTEIGLGDPAQTAVAAGMIWGIKGWLWGELHRRLRVDSGRQPFQPVFGVCPDFQRTGLRIDFSCRLKGRLGGIVLPWLAIAGRLITIRIQRWCRGLVDSCRIFGRQLAHIMKDRIKKAQFKGGSAR